MKLTVRARAGLLGVVLALPACTTTESSLRARFAREHGCPPGDVKVTETRGVDYHVTGCGESADYVCGAVATLGSGPAACELRGAQRKPGGDPPPFPPNFRQPAPPGPGQPPEAR